MRCIETEVFCKKYYLLQYLNVKICYQDLVIYYLAKRQNLH
ncbi:hypothetical protein MPL3365_130532 [Mesorhizobium plurifarium]|uniref:Uncharacterized protein n=1 Tax=Mesorhizobium plurifarium TaxID=69974 RepID=A0A090GSY7_MESPL|nr:hypothetical protein MPL3365_130532 [Mesorhizobium plurifarium]